MLPSELTIVEGGLNTIVPDNRLYNSQVSTINNFIILYYKVVTKLSQRIYCS